MRYSILVKPNARTPKVEAVSPSELRVWVDAPPVEGKANKRLIEILAEHFGVAKSGIVIAKGGGGRKKLVDVG